MNGFLVIGVGVVHDVPLALFDERRIAIEFAQDATAEEVAAAIRKTWGVEDVEPVGIVLTAIVDCEPGEFLHVKSFP